MDLPLISSSAGVIRTSGSASSTRASSSLPPPGDTDALSADDGKLDVWADEGGNHFCMVYYFGIINRYCLHKASCLKVRPMSV